MAPMHEPSRLTWQREIRKPINLVIAALALLAAFLIAMQFYLSAQLGSIITAQDDYQAYKDRFSDLIQNVTNAETGQRGYLISQDTAYLAPYNAALPAIKSDLAFLSASPYSRPYRGEFDAIAGLIASKLAELASTMQAEQQQGQAAAFAIVDQGTGLAAMNQIRTDSTAIITQQQARLDAREAATRRGLGDVNIVTWLAVLCTLGLVIGVVAQSRVNAKRETMFDAIRQQFALIASHQLRTPATAIKQYLYLLLDGAYGDISPAQQKVLEHVSASNEQSIAIANSLLDMSRIESQGVRMSDEPIDITELIRDLSQQHGAAASARKQQRIDIDLPKTAISVKADPFYLRMAIDNLLDNASKYSGEGSVIHVKLAVSQTEATLTVRDEGIGVSEAELPLLFQKFTRTRAAIKVSAQGSGLGLYIAKLIISLHGGTIDVRSKPAGGTTFIVRLARQPVA